MNDKAVRWLGEDKRISFQPSLKSILSLRCVCMICVQVVRVWFCNRRQKEKRMLSGALNAVGGLMMSDPGSTASSDVHDDCSPASRSSSADHIADDTRAAAPTVYPPHSVDYCNALSPPRRDYCPSDSSAFQSSSTHAPPEVGLSSYACAVSGWPSHLRSPQFASLMVAAAAGAAMLPDTHAASSLAM